MHSKWMQRLTLGLAAVALFAAAGGPSYAAKKVKAISGSKIKKNSIAADRLTSSARLSLKGNAGPQGSKGDRGDKGDAGTGAAYGSFFGTASSATLDSGGYNKNIISASANGAGNWCVYIDWAAAGRTPVQQGTPVITSSRSATLQTGGDVYNASCPGNGVSVTMDNNSGTPANGWFHVLIP